MYRTVFLSLRLFIGVKFRVSVVFSSAVSISDPAVFFSFHMHTSVRRDPKVMKRFGASVTVAVLMLGNFHGAVPLSLYSTRIPKKAEIFSR